MPLGLNLPNGLDLIQRIILEDKRARIRKATLLDPTKPISRDDGRRRVWRPILLDQNDSGASRASPYMKRAPLSV